MPIALRELTDEEAAHFEKPQGKERSRIAEEYRQELASVTPGKWVEVVIPEGDKRITVKNRLNRAAEELDLTLTYKRTSADKLIFKAEENHQEAPQ